MNFALKRKFDRTGILRGGLGNDMGTFSQTPPAPVGSTCSLFKTEQGKYVVAGDETLLRDYFENNPEQWLRIIALAGEENETE